MAARKKQLHEKRGITFAELGALLGTREMLKRGLLEQSIDRWADTTTHKFNMHVSCRREGCGSVACIGGTMAMIMGMDAITAEDYVANKRSQSLDVLFFPPNTFDWDTITTKRAIKAIDNWLATGNPKWYSIPGIKRD